MTKIKMVQATPQNGGAERFARWFVRCVALATILVIPWGARVIRRESADRSVSGSLSVQRRGAFNFKTMSALPIAFAPERRQGTQFVAQGQGYSIRLSRSGAELFLESQSRRTITARLRAGRSNPDSAPLPMTTRKSQFNAKRQHDFRVSDLRIKFVGANPRSQVIAERKLPGTVNYFLGDNPAKWRAGIPTFARVRYARIYPGIDLLFRGHGDQLEYDFLVEPGANPNMIRLVVASKLPEGKIRNPKIEIAANGDLVIRTGRGEVRFQKPMIYQERGFGLKRRIPSGRFVLAANHEIGFEVGHYDKTLPLVIDPVLTYSTYLGGNGTDEARAIALDAAGDLYLAGTTTSTNFPTTSGVYAKSLAGTSNIFVSELNPAGSALLYSTYLGGDGTDVPTHIAVDASGNAYIVGATTSSNFPTTVSTFQAASKVTLGNNTAFVTKLNPTGTGLVYSTYLGGSALDVANSLAIDSAGDAYITGLTYSTNFPTTATAFQTTLNGNGSSDAFVTELNSAGNGLVYSTFLGGSGNDSADGIAIDSTGAAYIAGTTTSTNFPTVGTPLQSSNAGGSDVFISKLAPGGGSLDYSTYLGGSGNDAAADIAVDSSGNAFVTGNTTSTDFPVKNAYQSANGSTTAPNAFVAEINNSGSALTYSTYVGGSGIGSSGDTPNAIALDGSDDAYIAGQTFSSDFPTLNSIQSTLLGLSDAFVTELSPSGSSLVFSTYLSGTGNTNADGIVVSSAGNIYVAGKTDNTDFPTLEGGDQTASAGGADAFVAEISPANSPASSLNPTTLTFSDQSVTTTSAPQIVTLRNMGSADLSISSIVVTGDYSESDDCFTDVPAASKCSLDLTFSPTATGSRTGTLTINDNAAGGSQTVSLTGTGINPSANLFPNSLTFASQNLGTDSAPQTVTLTNVGSDPMTISSISVSGSAGGDFGETNNCPLTPATLAASANCTITVTFHPTQANSRKATLSISDNAPNSPQTVTLTGTGNGPGIALSPASLSYNEQPLGTTSGAQTITVTNNGNQPLTISGATVTGAFSETNNCLASIAANGTCTISVTFKPTVAGTSNGALAITDNAPLSPQTVLLTGNAISTSAPEAYLSPPTLTYAAQLATTPFAPQTITLENTGNAALAVTSVVAKTPGDFSQTNNCSASLAGGASCTINVTFISSSSAGAVSGTLTVTDNASNSPQILSLTGNTIDFSIVPQTPAQAKQTINAGSTATFALDVIPLPPPPTTTTGTSGTSGTSGATGFNLPVALSCSGVPFDGTCTISPVTVTPDGKDPSPFVVSVTTKARSGAAPFEWNWPRIPFELYCVGFLAMLALGWMMVRRMKQRTRLRRLWLAIAFLLPLTLFAACGVNSLNGTAAGTYTIVVTGKTKSGTTTVTNTSAVSLTVN